jgi:hypothetical protein
MVNLSFLASGKIKKDIDVIKYGLDSKKTILNYINNELKNDKNIILEYPQMFKYLSDELKDDNEIAFFVYLIIFIIQMYIFY